MRNYSASYFLILSMIMGCSTQKNILCGGYTGQRSIADNEMEMFLATVTVPDMDITPLTVATQVVAGTNYKFIAGSETCQTGAEVNVK